MKKVFELNGCERYTITEVTAIAGCDMEQGTRQDALLVVSCNNGETFEAVVFGYEMPDTAEDFELMSEDSTAWESDYEVVRSVQMR